MGLLSLSQVPDVDRAQMGGADSHGGPGEHSRLRGRSSDGANEATDPAEETE